MLSKQLDIKAMESKSGFFDIFFSRGQFDNLKIAIICFVLASIIMLNLFQNPFVQLTNGFVFDDVSSFRKGFFYEYFFNFSNIFSSILTVTIFVLFVVFQVVMLNHFVNTWSRVYIFFIVTAMLVFYIMITTVIPYVEKKEATYLSGSEISRLVYQGDYNKAYGIIQESTASDYAKSYMTAQVSLQKKMDLEGDVESEELLLSDANALNYSMIENGNNLVNMDRAILYRIYAGTGKNHQLSSLEQFAKNDRIKAFIYIGGIVLLLLFGAYNLIVYRRVIGF